MPKLIPAVLAGVLTLSTFALPSYAADGDTTADKAAAASSNRGAVSSDDASTVLANTAVLPIKMVAVGSAFAIGTPIAVARCEAKELGQYSNAMVTEMNNNQMITPLMVASIPGQCLKSVGAVGKGIIKSTNNAASAWKEPFSAKSLSMEDLDN